jgi:DNA-binding transcriptional LysR family regulator
LSYVNNIRMFVRVYELGNMSAAARDQRTSPAVASARISELEKHLGVRLFNRTTRSLQATENGRIFYDGARRVLEAIDEAEAAVVDVTQNPRGTIHVATPLGIGRRLIAPHVPAFKELYPDIDVRLRLSDRVIDVVAEGIDVAFHLGILEDSTLKVRLIAECPRILCAAPAYIARRGMPGDGTALVVDGHDCLNLRFPGAKEFQWTLITADGPRRFEIAGPFESDDGDVLTGWALDGARNRAENRCSRWRNICATAGWFRSQRPPPPRPTQFVLAVTAPALEGSEGTDVHRFSWQRASATRCGAQTEG